MKYNVETAIKFSNECKIEEFIDSFLRNEGNNVGLADGLQLQKRYWIGPIELPLNALKRVCGPEEGMEYYNEEYSWNKRVNRLRNLMENGWEIPPLIIEHNNGILSVRDGNGRHEAMKRIGIQNAYVFIWDSESLEALQATLKEYIV